MFRVRCPHARGGVPCKWKPLDLPVLRCPHARGGVPHFGGRISRAFLVVVPMLVGVFRSFAILGSLPSSVVPMLVGVFRLNSQAMSLRLKVVPMLVGVFRRLLLLVVRHHSVVPMLVGVFRCKARRSPAVA